MGYILKNARAIYLILLLSKIVFGQNLTNQEMLEFYPNNIGNSWSYWWIYNDPINNYSEMGRDFVEILQDTIINNTKYWVFINHYKGSPVNYSIYLERIDSTNGDVFRIEDLSNGVEHRVDNLYASVGDTLLISENRYLLYSKKIVVLSIRDTVINEFPITIREVIGYPYNQKLFFARNIGMLGSGENYWIDTAKVNGNIYGNISSDLTDVGNNNKIINDFILSQNYPNPFNPTTTIEFMLPESDYIKLSVYNILGQKITTLINEKLESGLHKVIFNSNNLGSGVYYYQLKTKKYTHIRKMNLLK
jgi:hypothetical protein